MRKRAILIFLIVLLVVPPIIQSESLGGVTLLSVEPRIITPNGDRRNDSVFFRFDTNLSGLPIETSIFDIHGAKVSNMTFNSNQTALVWDGKDDGGRSIPAGIYLYSIKIGKNLATGAVVVAK